MKSDEFLKRWQKMIAEGRQELADVFRRNHNKRIMNEHTLPNCFVGDDSYFFEEGNKEFRRIKIIEAVDVE